MSDDESKQKVAGRAPAGKEKLSISRISWKTRFQLIKNKIFLLFLIPNAT
jgi:hypothetical protein